LGFPSTSDCRLIPPRVDYFFEPYWFAAKSAEEAFSLRVSGSLAFFSPQGCVERFGFRPKGALDNSPGRKPWVANAHESELPQ
jgi:hypothetical protein